MSHDLDFMNKMIIFSRYIAILYILYSIHIIYSFNYHDVVALLLHIASYLYDKSRP